jgi:peptidoglycan/xylan/chitin deacetylase (PgdA/CDA1 family)
MMFWAQTRFALTIRAVLAFLVVAVLILHADPLRLTPQQAIGGRLITLGDGTVAVTHPETATTNKVDYGWVLPELPTNDWWRVKLTLAASSGYDLSTSVDFEAGTISWVNFTELPAQNSRTSEHEILFYGRSRLKRIFVRRIFPSLEAAQRTNLATLPVISVEVEPSPAAPTPQSLCVAELSVQGEAPAVPNGLPAGRYDLSAYGSAEHPACRVLVTAENGEQPLLPLWERDVGGYAAPFYLNGLFTQLRFDAASNFLLTVFVVHRPVLELASYSDGKPPVLLSWANEAGAQVEEFALRGDVSGGLPGLPALPYGKTVAFITSWDDGLSTDPGVIKVLKDLGMRGTFFVLRTGWGFENLGVYEEAGMEIGAHSTTHARLSQCSPAQALEECGRVRQLVERAVGHPVISFAYPYGDILCYDSGGNYVVRAVEQSGYVSARTPQTATIRDGAITNLFLMPVSAHLSPAPGLDAQLKGVWDRAVQEPGSIVYLWSHSSEFPDTNQLATALAPYARRPEAWYASHGELALWNWLRQRTTIDVLRSGSTGMVVRLSRPLLHPYLAKTTPFSLTLPAGVTNVLWRGQSLQPSVQAISVVAEKPVAAGLLQDFRVVLDVSTNLTDWTPCATNSVLAEELWYRFGSVPMRVFLRTRTEVLRR